MARIFYSMSGEGRGHAVRARATVAALEKHHDITLFTPNDAHDFLEPLYRGTAVRVVRIPGPQFYYKGDHHLDYLRTAAMGLGYIGRLPRLLDRLCAHIRRDRPDVVITDFEPALPRAASRCGVPIISFDHQAFLIVNDLSDLPGWLRREAAIMSLVVRIYRQPTARTIVTSFFNPPLKEKYRNRDVIQVSSILRPSVVACQRTNAGHLVAYIRKFAPDNVMRALAECGRPVRLYGLGTRPAEGNITYHEINEANFLADLSSADGLICTAGNQLSGEAFYLGKPVLALPESKNFEQYINGFYVEKQGAGMWREMHKLTVADMKQFVANLGEYCARIEPDSYNGTPAAVAAIEQFIGTLKEKK